MKVKAKSKPKVTSTKTSGTGNVGAPVSTVQGTAANAPAGAPAGSWTPSQIVTQAPDIAPFDLEGAKRALTARRDSALEALQSQRTGTLLDYGFKLSDPNNPTSQLIGDPENPASKLAALQRSYQAARNGDLTSYAAMGQRNSGAYERQVATRNEGELLDTTGLSRAAGGILSGIAGAEAQVRDNVDAVDMPKLLAEWAAGTRPGSLTTAANPALSGAAPLQNYDAVESVSGGVPSLSAAGSWAQPTTGGKRRARRRR
jgi:hypothetical protein